MVRGLSPVKMLGALRFVLASHQGVEGERGQSEIRPARAAGILLRIF